MNKLKQSFAMLPFCTPTTALLVAFTFGMLQVGTLSAAERPIFSGPQVGEKLVPFATKSVFGKDSGEEVVLMDKGTTGPQLLIFVHQFSRPSLGLTRMLVDYAAKQKNLETNLVFLTNDATVTEATLKRARHALPKSVTPLISVDGIEGPGAYGLNRHTALTILVGKDGKVTGNFPLGQPSINVDAPKIGHAIVKAVGGKKAPTLKDMGYAGRNMMARKMKSVDGIYRSMMAPVIQKTATPEEVKKAATAVEEMAAKNEAFRDRVGKAANLIVNGGRLSNYGTETAQQFLKKWAVVMAPKEMAKSTGKESEKEKSEESKEEKTSEPSTDDASAAEDKKD